MILSILSIAAPLLLITTGALISEYAGRLAMFLEHCINLGAFLCYAFTLATGNLALGMVLSVAVCMMTVAALEKTASHFGANMFLVSLAMNLLFASLTSLLAAVFFNNRGVLTSELFHYDAPFMRLATSLIAYAVVLALITMLKSTTTGLALRVTGSSSDVLLSRGMNPALYRALSWLIASGCGALAGGLYTARLSAFVPGLAAGRGWTALAAVFLGRKRPVITIFAVLVFAVAEYASTSIQNIPGFASIPPSLLLALPYLVALLLLFLIPDDSQS